MSETPNIVMILADDLAVWGLGCYGNHEIRTPNIDRLAEDGIRFTEFYCTSPVCSPARASLLTGKIPSDHGVQDWIREGNGGPRDRAVDYLEGQRAYTEILAENGYTCGLSGKWHLGDSPRPQKGFSHWFAHPGGGGGYNDVQMFRDGEVEQTSGYLTDVITDDALSFIREQASPSRPFYLGVNYTAPHSPWVDQHPADLVESYADCAFESCPQEPRHPWSMHRMMELDNSERNAGDREAVTVRDHLQGYFAAVTAVDLAVGRIRDELVHLGIERDTLVIFASDNGFNCGHHGIWGKGNATFPQNMYDSSVKVPFIAAMPDVIEPGEVNDRMISGYDLMPTLLDFLGFGAETPAGLPGRSFADSLGRSENPTAEADRPIVVFDEYGPTRMIRTRRWKYVHRYPHGPHELFDLERDPGERVNLLVDERVLDPGEDARAQADRLRTELETWFDRYSDPRRDGRVGAVTGRGQLDTVGRPGVRAFHELESAETLDALRASLPSSKKSRG
jgi:arylsulfatase A-like enzyme